MAPNAPALDDLRAQPLLRRSQSCGSESRGDRVALVARLGILALACAKERRACHDVCKPLTQSLTREPMGRRAAIREQENPPFPAGFSYSGGRIRTCDLRVMSPTSYQTAPPRVAPMF